MLRKVRVDGPAERLEELVRAAGCAGLDIDDWAVDTTTAYGWPGRADGHAYVLVVADDASVSEAEVLSAIRATHEWTTGEPSDWIVPGGTFVYLPDGMEPEWYDAVVPLAEALHAAESCGEQRLVASIRAVLVPRINAVVPLAERRFEAFATFTSPPAPQRSAGVPAARCGARIDIAPGWRPWP